MKRHIPNTITCGNLFCGCLALVNAFGGNLIWASYFVGIALVLDFFDGFLARLLKVASPIGKDLDSLADMVTFGVVPGVIMFELIRSGASAMITDGPAAQGWTVNPPTWTGQFFRYLPYFAFIITVFSCIRLARFNNDSRQSDSFIGMPTPGNAIFICSIPLITKSNLVDYPLVLNPLVLAGLCLFLSILLVVELPLIALKFKSFAWKGNEMRYLLIISAVLLVIGLQLTAIPVIMALYILISIVNNIFSKKEV